MTDPSVVAARKIILKWNMLARSCIWEMRKHKSCEPGWCYKTGDRCFIQNCPLDWPPTEGADFGEVR